MLFVFVIPAPSTLPIELSSVVLPLHPVPVVPPASFVPVPASVIPVPRAVPFVVPGALVVAVFARLAAVTAGAVAVAGAVGVALLAFLLVAFVFTLKLNVRILIQEVQINRMQPQNERYGGSMSGWNVYCAVWLGVDLDCTKGCS